MTGDFFFLRECIPYSVTVADGNQLQSTFKGDVELSVSVNFIQNSLPLYGVLFVPGLHQNLISMSKLTDQGFRLVASADRIEIIRPARDLAKIAEQTKTIERICFD